MRWAIPLARLRFRRCRRWRCWCSGSGWPARSCRGWALLARVTWPTGRTLVHVLISGLLTQALAVHLPVPGADARRARRARRGDHLDEPRGHRAAGGDVPRRGPDLDAGRRAGRSACSRCWRPARADWSRSAVSTPSCCCCWPRWSASPRAASTSSGSAPTWTSGRRRPCRTRVALVPVAALAAVMPLHVTDPWKAAGAVAAVVLLNATVCMTMYVRGDQQLRRRRGGHAVRGHPRGRGPAVVADARSAARYRGRGRLWSSARRPAGSTPGAHASSVRTIQPATAEGSIASIRSISPP